MLTEYITRPTQNLRKCRYYCLCLENSYAPCYGPVSRTSSSGYPQDQQ